MVMKCADLGLALAEKRRAKSDTRTQEAYVNYVIKGILILVRKHPPRSPIRFSNNLPVGLKIDRRHWKRLPGHHKIQLSTCETRHVLMRLCDQSPVKLILMNP